MYSESPLCQNDITAAFDNVAGGSEKDEYSNRPLKAVTFKELRGYRERKNTQMALSLLQSARTKIVLQDEDQFLHNDPLTLWDAVSDKRLDYICTVGDRMGLDAILPNSRTDSLYQITIQLMPHFAFAGKLAQLGADQSEALFRIGFTPLEDFYVFMAPKEVFDGSYEAEKPGYCSGTTTRMKSVHTRIMAMFIAYVLYQMGDQGVDCFNWYSMSLPPGDLNWSSLVTGL